MAFSVDTTLATLLADPGARSVLEKHFGDRTNDPRIDQVMYESLRAISHYPEAGITSEKLRAVDEDLKALR